MSLPLLLEIGTEEIPDWMIAPALEQGKQLLQNVLTEHQLGGKATRADATPRRLVFWADGLAAKQADASETVMGPPVSAAVKDGKPTGAGLGFAKKMGVEFGQLAQTETPKGTYLSFVRQVPGRESRAVLVDQLPKLITQLSFPKKMYWTGKGGVEFIRPIRWLVALLGEDVVDFELAGVRTGKVTFGHRQWSEGQLPVTVEEYENILEVGFVAVSREARMTGITKWVTRLGGDLDPALVRTLADMTEWPMPLRGEFSDEFLALPSEVLVTVMRHHQRYFAVKNADGSLANAFIAVTNTIGADDPLIQRGHERVLRARFKDARFFYDTDQQKFLTARVDDLSHVTFQAKLGSYLEKTHRNVHLAKELAAQTDVDVATVERAALLCKTDLSTEMVKEFTDLQGIVGGLYAKAQGESAAVADAIYDHYLPLSMEGAIPRTPAGQVVALADKLDTLRGCFSVGMVPSGSKDPFALRRAAQGVVKILAEGQLSLRLSYLLQGDDLLREFFLDRLRYYFREIRGYAYDEVNAVLAAGAELLPDVEARLAAIKQVRPTENFEPLAASFKRIQNILRQAEFTQEGVAGEALLEGGPERDLYGAVQSMQAAVEQRRQQQDYVGALLAIAALRPQIDLFFDKVLVNAPDAAVRQNRLQLLRTLLTSSSSIADFSEIVTSS